MREKPVLPRRQVLRADGHIEELPRPVTIGEVLTIIGADCLDIVALKGGVNVMLVDDNGIAKGKPVNYAASILYQAKTGDPDALIMGDVVIAPDQEYE